MQKSIYLDLLYNKTTGMSTPVFGFWENILGFFNKILYIKVKKQKNVDIKGGGWYNIACADKFSSYLLLALNVFSGPNDQKEVLENDRKLRSYDGI